MSYRINGQEVSAEAFAHLPSKLEEMLATGQAPALLTDAVFLQGHCNGSQFAKDKKAGNRYRKQALAAGVNPKGKVYLHGLAAFPGDPRAWVSGRGDVQRVCEERGYTCNGAVTVKPTPATEEPRRVALAPDIVERETRKRIAKQPNLAAKVSEVREQVLQDHQPHWAK